MKNMMEFKTKYGRPMLCPVCEWELEFFESTGEEMLENRCSSYICSNKSCGVEVLATFLLYEVEVQDKDGNVIDRWEDKNVG